MKISLINGPNLNLLGSRNVDIYGRKTLAEIEADLVKQAEASGVSLLCFQSNSEGDIVSEIQARAKDSQGLIINPGAYSHTSIAIRDALECFAGPKLEVHLSNIFAREDFRHHSYISPVASGVICGLGHKGYSLALRALLENLIP